MEQQDNKIIDGFITYEESNQEDIKQLPKTHHDGFRNG